MFLRYQAHLSVILIFVLCTFCLVTRYDESLSICIVSWKNSCLKTSGLIECELLNFLTCLSNWSIAINIKFLVTSFFAHFIKLRMTETSTLNLATWYQYLLQFWVHSLTHSTHYHFLGCCTCWKFLWKAVPFLILLMRVTWLPLDKVLEPCP